jgi:hypothetical protein
MARRGIRARLGLDTEEALERWDDRLSLVVGVVAVVIILGAAFGGIVMLIRIGTHGQVPATGNPLELIFSSRLMVAASRLSILFIGVYIVLSILMHMRRGQWLTAAGPLKVSESVRRITRRVDESKEQLAGVTRENERLRTNLSVLTTELRTTEKLLEQAQKQLRGEGKT